MKANKNAVAAVAAAVEMYLLAEQQMIMSITEPAKPLEPPRPVWSAWAMAGRQSMVEMRRFYQMRLVR